MENRRFLTRVGILVALCVFALLVWSLLWSPTWSIGTHSSPYLQVHFLDIGQGDSALIETPSGVQVLVDGGADSTVLRRLGNEMSFFDRDIDIVVGTHPDKDHIGGLIDVLKRYKVHHILTTENKGETSTSGMYNKLKTAEGAQIMYARRGQDIVLDASTTLQTQWQM